MGKAKDRDRMELDGVVVEAHPGAMFTVKVNDMQITATLSGKMRQNFIKVIPGDKVKIEVSPYDTGKGRIISRLP